MTGESDTIEKFVDLLDKDTLLADQNNMAFMGTCVASGRAIGVVVSTGMQTQLAKSPLIWQVLVHQKHHLNWLNHWVNFLAHINCCDITGLNQDDNCLW